MTVELPAIRPKDVPVEEWRTALLERRVVATTHTAIAQVAAATLAADLQWEPRKTRIRQRRRRAPTDADMRWEAGTWDAMCDGMRLTDATWVDQLLTHEKYQISALSLLSEATFAWSTWNDITCKGISFCVTLTNSVIVLSDDVSTSSRAPKSSETLKSRLVSDSDRVAERAFLEYQTRRAIGVLAGYGRDPYLHTSSMLPKEQWRKVADWMGIRRDAVAGGITVLIRDVLRSMNTPPITTTADIPSPGGAENSKARKTSKNRPFTVEEVHRLACQTHPEIILERRQTVLALGGLARRGELESLGGGLYQRAPGFDRPYRTTDPTLKAGQPKPGRGSWSGGVN